MVFALKQQTKLNYDNPLFKNNGRARKNVIFRKLSFNFAYVCTYIKICIKSDSRGLGKVDRKYFHRIG